MIARVPVTLAVPGLPWLTLALDPLNDPSRSVRCGTVMFVRAARRRDDPAVRGSPVLAVMPEDRA